MKYAIIVHAIITFMTSCLRKMDPIALIFENYQAENPEVAVAII